jgi:hypothetical protein
MKYIKPILSVVILLSVLFGFWYFFIQKTKRPLPPEMILAQECGQDKLKCCIDEPKCSYGQKCCPDPSGAPRDYCSDECTCGGADEFCCAGDLKCQDGLSCSGGFCVTCGLAGGPCCETGEACLDAPGRAEKLIECRSGVCAACGVDGETACTSKERCAKEHLLNNGICYRCGGINQPCCRDEQGEQSCNEEAGLICELGFCVKQ